MLRTEFCGIDFANPLVVPSGIISDFNQYLKATESGIGGLTIKSISVEPRAGNPKPWVAKFDHGYLNAVGLANPGIKEGKKMITNLLQKVHLPIIVSLFATRIKDFQTLASEIDPLGAAAVELNISCPNVEGEFGKPLAASVEIASKVVSATKKRLKHTPLIAKLTPNVISIAEVARACEQTGANAICAINTVGPGMVIDIKRKKPVLGNLRGGVSGPAIKPVAVRCVYDIYEAVKIPIIGTGGVTTWQDAVEMMMAGATLVGVGSAVFSKGWKVFKEIKEGLENYLKKEKIKNPYQLVGTAH